MGNEPKTLVDELGNLGQVESLKKQVSRLKSQLSDAYADRERDADFERFIGSGARKVAAVPIPKWAKAPAKKGKHSVIPVAMFSDWHLDEVVKPEQIQYLNGYNRHIAEVRLKRYFQNIVELCDQYMRGFDYSGIVVPMLGDNFSGDIHEELRETNGASMLSSLLHWLKPAAAGLTLLADHFGEVWAPVVVGNHGRQTRKPVYKNRVESNYDWFFAKLLEERLKDDPRIHFSIPLSHKLRFSVFDTEFLASHGDEARGGSGIVGALSPLMLADHRARKTHAYDYWLCGHWHQRLSAKGVKCNGAGKGYDEYAMIQNFEFRWPEQHLFLVDSAYGVTGEWPVHLIDPNEEWIERCPKPIPGARNSKKAYREAA